MYVRVPAGQSAFFLRFLAAGGKKERRPADRNKKTLDLKLTLKCKLIFRIGGEMKMLYMPRNKVIRPEPVTDKKYK